MAFYKSKYTGTEIDQRLTQGTYDDAVKAGFTGSKEEFDKIIVAFDENAQQKLDAAQPKIDYRLETLNKSIVDAINELHDEVNQKQDIGDYVDKLEFEVFKEEAAATYATKGQVSEEIDRAKEAEEKLSDSINTVNSNLVNSINTLNKNVSDSLKVVNEAIQQSAETLVAEIEQRKQADSQLETSISQETTAREALAERVSTLENADYQTGDDVTAKINEVVDNAPEELNTLKKIAGALNNDPDFATTMTTELSKKLDSDKLLAGAGIDVREEDGKKIVDISEDTLTKIQYADSEVRRLETAKIPYAYDEKTQSNINVILPEGGSYLGNYGDENTTIAKAAVYDGTKQLEIGSSKVHTNINTDSDVTIETSTGKKVIATIDQIPDVFETKGLTELETGESSANIEAALGIDFASLIEIIRENKTVIVDRNSAGDYKACIHATGNISSDNGAANLMFFVGTTPTIYQIQYVSGTFALAVDEYKFATKSDISNLATKEEIPSLDGYVTETALDEKGYLTSIPEEYITETELEDKNYATKSEIPDVSELATKEELVNKVDWVDYQNTKNIVLPSNGQVFGDFGGEESNSSLLGARIYNAGLENEEKQVEVGTSKVHLNLNSLDKPTIETTDRKENLVVESDIELIPIEVNFPVRTSGGSDGPEDRIYTQEEILEWFGVADIAALKKQIANKGIQYVKYGITLMGNPHYYRMPVQYAAFESANQIKLVFIGLNTNDDAVSKYEILANLNETIIEGNSNVKMTITNLESKEIDLSGYVTKDEFNTMKTSLESQINNLNTTISQLQSLIGDK